MATSNAACAVWDFRTSADLFGTDVLKKFLKTRCKKWVFQKEQGEGGYVHYQGRFSLIKRLREKPVIDWLMTLKEKYPTISFYVGRTVTANLKKEFYMTKEETRVEGPWRDTDEEVEEIPLPKQLSEVVEKEDFKWYEWQQDVIESFQKFEPRKVNVIVDPIGNIGKSILKTYLGCKKIAMTIPLINDYKDLMRMVMDMPKVGGYIIDMPRAITKKNLKAVYAAIENVKDGYAFDDRYQFKYEYFNSPIVWVFTNAVPEIDLLSKDRWNLYKIVDNELVGYWETLPTAVEFIIVEPETKLSLGGPVWGPDDDAEIAALRGTGDLR